MNVSCVSAERNRIGSTTIFVQLCDHVFIDRSFDQQTRRLLYCNSELRLVSTIRSKVRKNEPSCFFYHVDVALVRSSSNVKREERRSSIEKSLSLTRLISLERMQDSEIVVPSERDVVAP